MPSYEVQHANPSGPGDARPTALQIIDDEGLVGALNDKVVLITGANQGLGLETVRALYATGATIYLGVRDLEKGQKAVDDILSSSKPSASTLHLIEMSLDSLDSVRAAAKSLLAQSPKLNILILNAGVMAMPEGRTKDGFESQFGICHVGHFLLFQLLQSRLLESSTSSFHSRVISLTSNGHRISEIRFDDINFDEPGSYHAFLSYGQAKLANIYLANEIERRYGAQGLHALSVHPGSIAETGLARYVGPEAVKQMVEDKEKFRFMKSPGQGAATTTWAAISKDWEGRGGRYLADCVDQGPAKPETPPMMDVTDPGYAPWAYNVEKAKKLWDISCDLVRKWNST